MRQDSFGGLLTHQALADGAPVVHQIGNGQHFATGQLQTLGRIIAEHAKPNSQGFGCLGELLATQLIEVDPQHLKPVIGFGQCIQLGNLGSARPAPFGPVVDQQPTPLQLRRGDFAPMLIDTPAVIAGR